MSYSFVQVNDFTPAKGEWTSIGNIQDWSVSADKRIFLLTPINQPQQNQVQVRIEILGPSAYRVRFNPLSTDYSQDFSYAVLNRDLGETHISFSPQQPDGGDSLIIELDEIILRVGLKPYGIAVMRGEQIIHQDTYEYNLVYIPGQEVTACFKTVVPGAGYYGFGEKAGVYLNKNKFTMTFFNYDNFTYAGSNTNTGIEGNFYPVIPTNNEPGPLNPSEPLYNSMPIIVEWNPQPPNDGYFAGNPYACAVFLDNPGQTYINIQANDYANMDGRYYFGGLYGEMSYYFMAGEDVPSVLKQYITLTGPAPLPPMYALGYQQGCYGYYDRDRLFSVAKAYRENNFPIDGLHIDVDFQNNYRTFTNSTLKFPNVSEIFKILHQEGFKCSTNITGIITTNPEDENSQRTIYQTLREGLAKDVFVQNKFEGDKTIPEQYASGPSGERFFVANESYGSNRKGANGFFNPYPYPNPPYDPSCSGGNCKPLGTYGHYPDMGKTVTREWWGEQYKYLVDAGLDMIWQDMTCPATARSIDSFAHYKTLPLNVMMTGLDQELTPNAKIHNAFAINLISATYSGLTKLKSNLPEGHYNKNKRNFIIGRGGYAGVHRYAANWTGDSATSWDFLKIYISEVLNWGMSGQPLSGCDIGGFANGTEGNGYVVGPGDVRNGQPPDDLLTRWMTTGAFLPWYRNHYDGYTKAFQEPYNYGTDSVTFHACKKYVEIRYKLLQLFYDAMYNCTKTGIPICRALFLNDPTDLNLYQTQSYRLNDQFFVGRDLLVAPQIYQGNQREVYLPSNYNWYVYTDNIEPLGPSTVGGKSYQWTVPLDKVPIYVREGAIIPVRELEQYVGQKTFNPITFSIYPGKSSTYTCYEDDHISMTPQSDGTNLITDYRITEISHSSTANFGQEVTLRRTHDTYQPESDALYYFVSFLGRSIPLSIVANGIKLTNLNELETSDNQNAEALAAYSENAYYYNHSLQTTFIKIFDSSFSGTIPQVNILVDFS